MDLDRLDRMLELDRPVYRIKVLKRSIRILTGKVNSSPHVRMRAALNLETEFGPARETAVTSRTCSRTALRRAIVTAWRTARSEKECFYLSELIGHRSDLFTVEWLRRAAHDSVWYKRYWLVNAISDQMHSTLQGKKKVPYPYWDLLYTLCADCTPSVRYYARHMLYCRTLQSSHNAGTIVWKHLEREKAESKPEPY